MRKVRLFTHADRCYGSGKRLEKPCPESGPAVTRQITPEEQERLDKEYEEYHAYKEHKLKQKTTSYHKTKYKNDVSFRLHQLISKSIRHYLKTNNTNKNGKSWLKYVDYTVDDLKLHLESQFQDGMSWDNYGEWHIDHVKPASLFPVKSPDDTAFRECWSLSNLQPLWASDNTRKSNKHEEGDCCVETILP